VHSAAQCRRDRSAIEALAADYDKPRLTLLANTPSAVEVMLEPIADGLHNLPPVAARHVDKPLHPQHVVQTDRDAQTGKKRIVVLYGASGHDEAFEIVVIVFRFELVDRVPGSEVILGGNGETECDPGRHPPLSRDYELDTRSKAPLDFAAKGRQAGAADEISLVAADEISLV
jgi:hypothetical protein